MVSDPSNLRYDLISRLKTVYLKLSNHEKDIITIKSNQSHQIKKRVRITSIKMHTYVRGGRKDKKGVIRGREKMINITVEGNAIAAVTDPTKKMNRAMKEGFIEVH